MILSKILESPRKVVVFIDKAPEHLSDVTLEIMKVLERFKNQLQIEIIRAEQNIGVAKAVPFAISKSLGSNPGLIVLEDDCIPNSYAFEYFDSAYSFIRGDTVMVCGRSYQSNASNFQKKFKHAGLSSYPLINGWVISNESWGLINPLQFRLDRMSLLDCVVRRPRKIPAIGYFLAAYIRVIRGELKAWDSILALNMLTKNLKCLVPDRTVIKVLGVDAVASNTLPDPGIESDLYLNDDIQAPSGKFDFSAEMSETIDSYIENQIYNVRLRHSLSPLKAFLIRR
jgi:hypothetical protein